MRAGYRRPLGHDFFRGQDGHQTAIAQYERQVRRRIVVRPLKDFIARENFAHQRLSGPQAGDLAQLI